MSLLVHPDRVTEAEKETATEKFKILTKLHATLTDKDKKALYDEQGIIDDDGDSDVSWLEMWRQFFKPITTTDIDNFKKEYIGKWANARFRLGSPQYSFIFPDALFRFGYGEARHQESISRWFGLHQLHAEQCAIYGCRR